MINGKEKLYFLLNRIDDAKAIAPSGQPLIIDPLNDLNDNIREVELSQLFPKLEKDQQVLKVLKIPRRTKTSLDEFDPYDHADDGCWHIKLLPAFGNYFLKIQQEPEYQEFMGKKPSNSPTKTNSDTLMTYEKKLDLIVKAIVEAKKATRKGQLTTLYLNSTNGLDRLELDEIRGMLLQLQDEKIVTLHQKTNRLLPLSQQSTNPSYLFLDILDGFDNWYASYQIKQKGKIENLSETNLKEVSYVLSQIEDQLQLSQSSSFNFSFVSSIHEIEGFEREDIDDLTNGYIKVLDYLNKVGVIVSYSHGEMSLDADIVLNIGNFYEALDNVKKVKTLQKKVETDTTETAKIIPTTKTINVTYDPKKGTLDISGKSVKFNKDSFRAKLLELLLKDNKSIKKEWSWDEVIEEIEGTKDQDSTKDNKKKFYPACDGLSKFIAQKIGINDLLVFNKSTVQINSKYL
jgi:hypothetical protein